MPKFDYHIFVCTNHREPDHPRGSCDPENKGELLKVLKSKVSKRGVKGCVRVNKAGCLDQCEHGPTIVVYPEAVWYGGVKESDLDEIVESHLVNGKPVERLRIADSCLNTQRCPHRGPDPKYAKNPESESPSTTI